MNNGVVCLVDQLSNNRIPVIRTPGLAYFLEIRVN